MLLLPSFCAAGRPIRLQQAHQSTCNSCVLCPCRQAQQQQPRETLEQHLYAFLTQKYGMRQLIMEWLSAILAAVEHFAPRDADVALFDKVLRQAPASCSWLLG